MAQRTKSETADVRTLLSPWCQGYGIDVGPGGDKILPQAISVDLVEPYAFWGSDPVQLGGDARNLYWFNDSVLDYVYSSHLLEDFEDTVGVINELTRVLKLNGNLVLYLPDEQLFRKYCLAHDQPGNLSHKHAHFGPAYLQECMAKSNYSLELVFDSGIVNHYSFAHVYKKRCYAL